MQRIFGKEVIGDNCILIRGYVVTRYDCMILSIHDTHIAKITMYRNSVLVLTHTTQIHVLERMMSTFHCLLVNISVPVLLLKTPNTISMLCVEREYKTYLLSVIIYHDNVGFSVPKRAYPLTNAFFSLPSRSSTLTKSRINISCPSLSKPNCL